jgi:geranyl-CoA carboxylase alpha subunit
VTFSGHAIEVRLCAEDAAKNFMPQAGRMLRWERPSGVRVEDAMEDDSDIPPYYDSMIAKIVSHAPTRDEARRKLAGAMNDLVALGVTTNQSFLRGCLDHPAFAAGEATTAFVEVHSAQLQPETSGDGSSAAMAALLLHASEIRPRHRALARSLAHRLPIPMKFDIDGKMSDVTFVQQDNNAFRTTAGARDFLFRSVSRTGSKLSLICDGVRSSAVFARDGSRLYFKHGGRISAVEDMTHAAVVQGGRAAGSDGKLRASMNGRVVAVLAAAGDHIDAGAPIIVLEAMKMQHVHAAPLSGKIASVSVAEGDQVTTRFVMAEIEPA